MSFFDRNSVPEALLYNGFLEQDETPRPKSLRRTSARPSFRSLSGRHTASSPRSRRTHDKQHHVWTRNRGAQSNDGHRVTRRADTAEEPASSLEDDIQLLQDYSLVTIVASPPSFEMHRLVQLATQDWLKADGSFERWGSQFRMNLDEAFPAIEDEIEEFDVCRSLLPHAFAAMDIELHNREPLLRQASILVKAALHVYGTRAYSDSRRMKGQALGIKTELLGPEHIETIRLMQIIGVAYTSTRQYERAESMMIETLNRCQRLWGKDDSQTLDVMQDLAAVYSQLGKLVDAEMMQTRVLRKFRKRYGEEHATTLAVMIDYTDNLWELGRYKEAEELANKAMTIARKLYPARLPSLLLRALHSQAQTYYAAGKYEEARRLSNESFLQSSEVLGNDHPETLGRMYMLACTCYRLGRRRFALDLLRDFVGKSERKLGSHHLDATYRHKQLREWEAYNGLQDTAEDVEESGNR